MSKRDRPVGALLELRVREHGIEIFYVDVR
jgi:hypothetical protein